MRRLDRNRYATALAPGSATSGKAFRIGHLGDLNDP
jgi:aspartate aminotransferase-like enzyme